MLSVNFGVFLEQLADLFLKIWKRRPGRLLQRKQNRGTKGKGKKSQNLHLNLQLKMESMDDTNQITLEDAPATDQMADDIDPEAPTQVPEDIETEADYESPAVTHAMDDSFIDPNALTQVQDSSQVDPEALTQAIAIDVESTEIDCEAPTQIFEQESSQMDEAEAPTQLSEDIGSQEDQIEVSK